MIEKLRKLRNITNFSLNECKKALKESNGSIDDALNILNGVQKEKTLDKLIKDAKEGRIHTYVHMGGQIASMVEVNCETDFAARSKEFINFCELICLQIVAMHPTYISKDEISNEIEEAQRFFIEKKLSNFFKDKAETFKRNIIEERIQKWYQEVTLLEQTCIINQTKTIFDKLSELSAQLNEKVKISRFERWSIV